MEPITQFLSWKHGVSVRFAHFETGPAIPADHPLTIVAGADKASAVLHHGTTPSAQWVAVMRIGATTAQSSSQPARGGLRSWLGKVVSGDVAAAKAPAVSGFVLEGGSEMPTWALDELARDLVRAADNWEVVYQLLLAENRIVEGRATAIAAQTIAGG